jgi:hypothetical protein
MMNEEILKILLSLDGALGYTVAVCYAFGVMMFGALDITVTKDKKGK